MTVQYSIDVRDDMLNAWAARIGASAILSLYSGAVPADCAAGVGASVLLASFPMSVSWAGPAAAGAISFDGLPLLTAAKAGAGAGTVCTYYRICDSTGTVCGEQGTVTAAGGGGDLTLDNTTIADGDTVSITGYSKTAPGA